MQCPHTPQQQSHIPRASQSNAAIPSFFPHSTIMASSTSTSESAGLIAPAYQITVEVPDNDTLPTAARACDTKGVGRATRTHRSPFTAIGDFISEHSSTKGEGGRGLGLGPKRESDLEKHRRTKAQEIRCEAQQARERVPDIREAYAMARLAEHAEFIISAL